MDVNLTRIMQQRVEAVSTSFHRYMYSQINWERKMFGLVGPRGVGKPRHPCSIIRNMVNECKMFYVSADNVSFVSNSLIVFVDNFVRHFSTTKCVSPAM